MARARQTSKKTSRAQAPASTERNLQREKDRAWAAYWAAFEEWEQATTGEELARLRATLEALGKRYDQACQKWRQYRANTR